jgi:general secretion pathway protein D
MVDSTMMKAPACYGRLSLLVGLAVATLLLPAASRVSAQQATVHIEGPSTQVVAGGGPFTVSVTVEDVTNLGAFQLDLEYDPAILSLVEIKEGPFLGSSGRQVNCLPPRIEQSSAGFICVTLGATPDGPNGSGVLSTITFQPLAAGSGLLHFSRLTLTDPPAEVLPARAKDACLRLERASDGAFTPALWLAPAGPTEGNPCLGSDGGGGGGFAWAIWGPVIGIGALALAAAAVSGAWWVRRSRSA